MQDLGLLVEILLVLQSMNHEPISYDVVLRQPSTFLLFAYLTIPWSYSLKDPSSLDFFLNSYHQQIQELFSDNGGTQKAVPNCGRSDHGVQ